ncbi:MAG: YihY/virulence factor BrkB family protein [Deltaproteobacteria bacterium]|nr:YihY/virulence factor BrkB family protein [Deltaproteobacteria bacterium]
MKRPSDIVQFLNTDIWRLQANKLTPRRSFWIRQLRIFLLAIRRFNLDKCELRASALTFYSLLSIVPVVAMAFAVAKGFGFEKILGEQLVAKLEGHEEVAERIIGFAQSLLENTKGGAIAGVGVVVLFWTVIKVLGNIEKSFNDIWGVKTPRAMGRKLADYLSVMVICPVLLITAGSITVFLTTQITVLVERLSFLGYLADVLIFSLRILPYGVIWLVFTFIYVFMPNTKVEVKSALWGGVLAGTIYQVIQLAYILFQIGVSKYGAIYGSFAALPLFLVWLQLSWLIVLLGAEVSFAHQNVATYEFEQDCLRVSYFFKRIIALMIAYLCVKNFLNAEKPSTAEDIARELETPIRLVRSVLSELTEARVLSEVCLDHREVVAYQPACDIHRLTVAGVIERLDRRGITTVPVAESIPINKLRETVKRFREMNEQSPVNLRLQELCIDAQPKHN